MTFRFSWSQVMGKPGKPRRDLDDILDWQERLEKFKARDFGVNKFCV